MEALGAPAGGGPIYDLALTHRSFAFEQAVPLAHNERLEFLGDAILGAIVTGLIFSTYPDLSEGEMARLRASVVNTHALAEMARVLELGDQIRLGKGEEASGGRAKPSLLADTFEAVVGAVYVDRGIAAVEEVLTPLFADALRAEMTRGRRFDAKTALQEASVRMHGRLPAYRVVAAGPDHDKHFTAQAFVDGELCGAGTGTSKKEAEHNAALEALERLSREAPGAGQAELRGPDARAS